MNNIVSKVISFDQLLIVLLVWRLAPIKLKKMNNNFDDDIFGAEFELAEPS